MVREDLLGGLKAALAKGESLRQAMKSLLNSGYEKKDIEWAARTLQMQRGQEKLDIVLKQPTHHPEVKQIPIIKQPTHHPEVKQMPIIKDAQIKPQEQPYRINQPKNLEQSHHTRKPDQELITPIRYIPEELRPVKKVLDYGGAPKKPRQGPMIFLLIFFIIILLGVLVVVFIFKKELIDFFNNLI